MHLNWIWWFVPLVLAFGELRQVFEAGLEHSKTLSQKIEGGGDTLSIMTFEVQLWTGEVWI